MGHDISAFASIKDDNEIAYLRRNMWSDSIHKFYEALGATELDGGVSGTGEEKEFTEEKILYAIAQLKKLVINKEDFNDYKKFLDKCLKNMENGKVVISFG